MSKKRIHLINSAISARVHPISITVIGAGGNGSFFLQELARMEIAYRELYGNTFHVTCYDSDKVEGHNLGRQLFFEPDIGHNKANIMISRINLTYGFDWESRPKKWFKKDNLDSNFVIGCVDNIKTRKAIIDCFDNSGMGAMENRRNIYYIDIGNMADFGQVIMGTQKYNESHNCDFHHLMHFGEYYDIDKMDDKKDKETPSCSMADSISSQGLFTNRIAATLAASMMWDLLKNEYVDYHGYFFNMSQGKVNKLLI